jgi:hypothetical protein
MAGSSVAVAGDGSSVWVGAPGRSVGGQAGQGGVYVWYDICGWQLLGEFSDGSAGSLGAAVAVAQDGSLGFAGAPLTAS